MDEIKLQLDVTKFMSAIDFQSHSDEDAEEPEDSWAESQEQLAGFVSEEDYGVTDIDSDIFKALPLEVQHELITDMKEKNKKSSWKKISQLPKVRMSVT